MFSFERRRLKLCIYCSIATLAISSSQFIFSTNFEGFVIKKKRWMMFSKLTSFFVSRAFSKRVEAHKAIRILQRNFTAHLTLRQWDWWKLYVRIKPLLGVNRQDEELRAKDNEIKQVSEKLDKTTLELNVGTGSYCNNQTVLYTTVLHVKYELNCALTTVNFTHMHWNVAEKSAVGSKQNLEAGNGSSWCRPARKPHYIL